MDTTISTLFTIFHRKQGFPIFDTTDIKALNDVLHYSSGDREFYVDREISIVIDEHGRTKKYIITDIIVHYFEEKILNEARQFQGQVVPYNNQVMVYVDEL